MNIETQAVHADLLALNRIAGSAVMNLWTVTDILGDRAMTDDDAAASVECAKKILQGMDENYELFSRLTAYFTAAHVELAKAGLTLRVEFLGREFPNWHCAAIDAPYDALL